MAAVSRIRRRKVLALHRADVTLTAFAKREKVTFRFAQMWAAGERTSAKLDHAFELLTRRTS